MDKILEQFINGDIKIGCHTKEEEKEFFKILEEKTSIRWCNGGEKPSEWSAFDHTSLATAKGHYYHIVSREMWHGSWYEDSKIIAFSDIMHKTSTEVSWLPF